jgi:hypothetical protein
MKSRLSEKSQSQAFESAATALDCDPSEEAFNAALGKIARAKPVAPPVKKPKVERPKG